MFMTLSEFVTSYINDHGMSKRQFATMTGISVQQISNIMKSTGNSGKPMTSTMATYKKIANAIGMSESDFLLMINDKVRVNPALSDDDMMMVQRFHRASPEIQNRIRSVLEPYTIE